MFEIIVLIAIAPYIYCIYSFLNFLLKKRLSKIKIVIITIVLAIILLTIFSDSIIELLFFNFVLVILKFIYNRVFFKSRVKKYIRKYIKNIDNFKDRENDMTEACFFEQAMVKKFLKQRKNVNGGASYVYLQKILKETVLLRLKKQFYSNLIFKNKVNTERIFFYYEFYHYVNYFKEQKISFIDYLDNLGIIDSYFVYIDDVAFFSNDILNQITNNFIPYLKENPNLSEVPFSENYLFNSMYNNGFLNNHIQASHLELLRADKKLFEEDLIDLYSAVINEELENAIDNNLINEIPKKDEDDEVTYSLSHENEDGIIEKEYGLNFEQNRVSCDVDTSELDNLDIPA